MTEIGRQQRSWTTRQDEKRRRMNLVNDWMNGLHLPAERIIDAMEVLLCPGDKVALEGNNQKQAAFLSSLP